MRDLVFLLTIIYSSTAANVPVFQALSEASQHTDISCIYLLPSHNFSPFPSPSPPQPWLTKFVQHPGTTTDSTTWASIELNLSIICTCLPILRNPLRIMYTRTFGTTVESTANATIGSSHHRLDPWEEESNGTSNTRMKESSKLRLDDWENNGTSSNNRTSLLDLDNVAVSDFVGSRGREMDR